MKNTDNISQPPVLLTRDEVAQVLATSDRHVRRLIEDGRLPSVRLGGKVRIHTRQLDEFVDQLCHASSTDAADASEPEGPTIDRCPSLNSPVAPRPVTGK